MTIDLNKIAANELELPDSAAEAHALVVAIGRVPETNANAARLAALARKAGLHFQRISNLPETPPVPTEHFLCSVLPHRGITDAQIADCRARLIKRK